MKSKGCSKVFAAVLVLILCLAMSLGTVAVAEPMSENIIPKRTIDFSAYESLKEKYHHYTYIGDSIAVGYGMWEDTMTENDMIFGRVDGTYGDLILEALGFPGGANGLDGEIRSDAYGNIVCSGWRSGDIRAMIEHSFGDESFSMTDITHELMHQETEEAYTNWDGNGLNLYDYTQKHIRESDLFTIDCGSNDVFTTTIINLAYKEMENGNEVTTLAELFSGSKVLEEMVTFLSRVWMNFQLI